MIIHECKAIFIHIPKTAGVSIRHSIMSHLTDKEITGEIGYLSQELKLRFELRNAQKHKQARFYNNREITKKQWNSYYKFAIVRNPWDRVVSEFHWRQTLPTRHPSTDFKEFLSYCESRIDDKSNKKRDIYWDHAQTQKSFVTDQHGTLILDEFFRFEDLKAATTVISKKLNISLDLGRYNTSTHENYQRYYNDETKAIVERLYKEDIEMFNYKFGD